MNDETLDYKLHRLKKGKSTFIDKGNWAYLASNGSLHKLVNHGYYFKWRCDMWVHSFHGQSKEKGTYWGCGEIAPTKKALIELIESKVCDYQPWITGYGKSNGIELGV